MKSIYLELLKLGNINDVMYPIYTYDEYDEYDDYEEKRSTAGEAVEAIPLKRDILAYGDDPQETVDIEDLKASIIHANIPQDKLDKYIDGDIYYSYPVAASFLMSIHDYRFLVEAGVDQVGVLQIIHFDENVDYLFNDGIIVMAFIEGGKMRVVAGFREETEADGD